MIATRARRKPARKSRPARPVTAVLLELVYFLHATRVIDRPAKSRSER